MAPLVSEEIFRPWNFKFQDLHLPAGNDAVEVDRLRVKRKIQ